MTVSLAPRTGVEHDATATSDAAPSDAGISATDTALGSPDTSPAHDAAAIVDAAAAADARASTTGDPDTRALQPRDLDGDRSTIDAYYNPALDLTWLADANAGAGSAFDDGLRHDDGRMTWRSAMDWAAALHFGGPGAASGWRLPTMIDTGAPGCAGAEFSMTGGTSCGQNVIVTPASPTNYSEMGYLFQEVLGNTPAFSTTPGEYNPRPWLRSTAPFVGIHDDYDVVWYGSPDCDADPRNCRDDAYWTDVPDASSGGVSAWKFLFGEGEQIGDAQNVEYFAWGVHDGDVGTPVP